MLSIIKSMKPKTSSCLDEISSKLVIKCKEELTVPLTHIINCSIHEGIFPEKLKISKVYPKFKNGSTTEARSYRPISLTSTFSKIIEKVILHRLMNYLIHNNLLTDNQHGFLKGRSTVTAIIQLIEHVIDQIESGKTVTSLFLDFSKAFDCLDHDLLLRKLCNLGINGISGNWFRSYLTGRKQLVELKHNLNGTISKVRSAPLHIKRGVPQGSVLGPVLFLLLTNDLPEFMDSLCQTVMYADDTVLTLAHKNKEQLRKETNTSFDLAKQFCRSNDLVLNENKTVQITYSTRGSEPDGLPNVKVEASTKYLGITLDMNLKWNTHIEVLCKKLAAGIYVIRRIKQICGTPAARIAYFSLFEAHVRYGISAWGGTTNSNMERVLLHQKKAIRILADLKYLESCQQAFQEHKILTVPALYISEVILLAISTNKTKLGDHHQYNTRNASNFSFPIHHLSLTEKKPTYKGALYFNNLPDHLKQDTGRLFKRKLLKWLEDHPFYTEKEFLDWRD
uniref:Reverse transcriptase domain-containing protein n=1 Tax=Cuerna arida TaxID=1464854 RepID=A0A1B6FIE1_9HEMI